MRIVNLLRSQAQKALIPRAAAGAPPGTMVYTGQQREEPVTVHLVSYGPERYEEKTAVGELPVPSAAPPIEGVRWYDLRGLHDLDLVRSVGTKYGMHPLTMEDVVDVMQRPKLEQPQGKGLLIIVKAFDFAPGKRQLGVEQVSIYLSGNTVISFQEDSTDLFARVRQRLATSSGRIRSRESDYLAYALVDALVDGYFTVIDRIEVEMDGLEEHILRDPNPAIKTAIHDLRLALLSLRKNVYPLRELMNQFLDPDNAFITPDTRTYATDLRDNVLQTADLVETYRDVNNGLYDLYTSELSVKMNTVMQTLTVVSTIFIPLSFLVGVYGMNWNYMPELNERYGYFVLWAVMIAIILGMLGWFRYRKWL